MSERDNYEHGVPCFVYGLASRIRTPRPQLLLGADRLGDREH